MPMEKVSFEFPDPDSAADDDVNVKEDGSVEIKIAGRETRLPTKKRLKSDRSMTTMMT